MNRLINYFTLLLLFSGSLLKAQPTWTQKTDYKGAAAFDFAGFSIGGQVYFGGGRYAGKFNSVQEWQVFNPNSNSWKSVNSMPNPFTGVTGFSIGGHGYLMNGVNDANYNYETYRFNAAADNWSSVSSFDYPRLYAASTSNGNYGYVIGGYGFAAEPLNDFWQYNPVLDKWTEKDSLPLAAARYHATAFSIMGNIYVFGGTNDIDNLNDLWKYDTITHHWSQKASLPGAGRMQCLSLVINNEAYIIGGSTAGGSNLKEVWKYNPISNSWLQLPSFPGTNAPIGGLGFVAGNKGYIIAGNGTKECWQFEPAVSSNLVENHLMTITKKIFPNPASASSMLVIEGLDGTTSHIVISNALGSILGVFSTSDTCFSFSGENYANGLYHVKVEDGQGEISTLKFMIQ